MESGFLQTGPQVFEVVHPAVAVELLDDPGHERGSVIADDPGQFGPLTPLVLDTLGWVLYKSGDSDQAYMTLQRSYEAAPSVVNCLHLGEVMDALGNRKGAEQMYLQAQDLAKESGDQQMLEIATKRLEEISR